MSWLGNTGLYIPIIIIIFFYLIYIFFLNYKFFHTSYLIFSS